MATQLIHHPYRAPAAFDAVPVGVYKASTVLFPNVAAVRARRWQDKSGYTYGLHGTPTTFTLEERIATLEGGRHCVLAPSGLAAIALVDLALLRAGDEVLLPDNAYGPNKALAAHELAHWGIGFRIYDPMDPADLAAAITPRTRLVWLEAAGSVTLEFPDLPALLAVVRQANAAREVPIVTALDDTWGAGIALRPFELGVDIALQALTKYPSGGADVLMGAVVTRDDALHQTLLMTHMRLGLGVGANDAEAVLRGLPSLPLRYQAQDASARALASWMQDQPRVARVFHPALPDSPGHAAWRRDARAAAALFSVVFDDAVSAAQVDAFCDALRCFRLGYSWAGPMSLCMPYEMPPLRQRPWRHAPHLVRFAVGLEDIEDLRADLAQAMHVLA
ncbi:PLP-dependent transferase [Tepidimonas charontis]|uniref:Cystathionine beta-lyase n=1 Tax=Tepidimonas charontis TaxID=2267262 RepID=A0A554XKT1_9BURK|nr:PLP-dependent transferase [Tepidimonas charontis]TSE36445.1 Cystathionine beta-lyase [Tepidimonas charontis]